MGDGSEAPRDGDLPPGSRPGASATGSGLRRRRRRRRLGWAGLAVSGVLVGAAGAGFAAYAKLEGNITPDEAAAAELERYEAERPRSPVEGARNILLIGSDSRSGADNADYGRDPGTERSDTVILLHLSAGREDATAVSLPRDLMVRIPDCRSPDGSRTGPVFAQLNFAFETGGSACTIRTVEKLTRIRVDHHVVVDFQGFKRMVDAVDGVEICLPEPIHDQAARITLPAGRVVLDGEQALGYVRARKSLGDGSDTERMARQQEFLGALAGKVLGNGVLLNPAKLYPVLDAATSSLTTDPELASLRGLYDLVRGLRDIPSESVRFMTVPRESYPEDANRDQLAQPAARELFDRLRKDEPVTVENREGEDTPDGYAPYGSDDTAPPEKGDSLARASESPAPTYTGNTAAEDSCS
ncbi:MULTISPECIES: LCP family protein [unclassified Streptomyces]|uniref:LCP family protein n=1 Tax=unclassified Streptomyces TaxID=2593676 RepID=UPI001907388A|nr:LCP family protein [Streptomyces sp. HSG2]